MGAVSRRTALKLLAGLGAISVLPAARWAMADNLPQGLSRFSESLEPRAAARLGRDYLDMRPEESDAGKLIDHITGGNEVSPELLAAAACSDFTAGRVVELRDWQVSLTEARIFALVALSQ